MSRNQASLNCWWHSRRRGLEIAGGTSRRDHHDDNEIQTNQHASEYWGTKLTKKQDNVFRIACCNINSLPTQNINTRNDELMRDLLDYNLDVLGITEVNVAWNLVDINNRPHERFHRYIKNIRIGYAYNKTDLDWQAHRQSGGTMILCNDHAAHRTIKFGQDTTGLGRWTWVLLQGKNGQRIRIVTAYRPVKALGPTTAYRQHQRYYLNQKREGCPRELFFDDLRAELQTYENDGDHLIVMGDFNCDIRGQAVQQFFHELHMHEAILHQHGPHAPSTFIRGSYPIDGVFINKCISCIGGGYSVFDWGISTDHRLLWIDISMDVLFGSNRDRLWKPQARRLQLEDIRTVQAFNTARLNHHKQHRLLEQIQDLMVQLGDSTTLSSELIPIVEHLDYLRVSGILTSEQHCRKLKVGNVPWSPALQQSINNIRYLRLLAGTLQGHRHPSSRTLLKLFNKTNLSHKPQTLTDLKQTLKIVYETYNQLKKNSLQLRSTHIETMAYHTAIITNQDPMQLYKNMLKREEQRALSRALKRLRPVAKGGVTTIEAPSPSTDLWQCLTTKQDVELGCIEENIRRFTQALDSPSLQDDQVDLLGWIGNTHFSDAILKGQPVQDLHPALRDFIPYLAQPPQVTTHITTSLSEQEYVSGWNKAKERTSSGKSKLHFGHFKASCLIPYTLTVDRLFLLISMQTGYALQRWCQGIDVMIPKKSDSIRVDKLRTICLVEPDFNFMNKIFGRRMMTHAEANKTIAVEQYGSRKHKSAILHATNKQLTFDIIRQQKIDASLLVLDAKSCYDRISPPIASLALRRQGAPVSYISSMFNALTAMKHYIRTAYGDSDCWYQQTRERFHGILQGNGAGPMIWVMTSSPILDKLRSEGCGIQLNSMDSTSIPITAFAFVDDVDIVQEINSANNTRDSQRTLDKWEMGLWATGGILVPDKSSWFLLRHHWTGTDWRILPLDKTTGQLLMHSCFNNPIPVQQLDSHSASLALGVMFSPSGNMNHHKDYLLQKTRLWAEQIRTGTIQRKEAWYSLQVQVMKTLEYSLLATTLSKAQLDDVMKPILVSGLPRSGICRNISRAVVFSSIKYQGLGLKHPYVTQGLRKLILFLENDTTICTTALIHQSWKLCAWECGLGTNFLSKPCSKVALSVVTSGWISCLWQFLYDYKITLLHSEPDAFRFQDDDFLMSRLSLSNISANHARVFNHCRLYLGVVFISDIVTLNGGRIRPNIWKGLSNSSSGIASQYNGRRVQVRPNTSAWRIWRQTLSTIFRCSDQGFLQPAINIPWFSPTNWRWFYEVSSDRIFECQHNTILCRSRCLDSNRRTTRSSFAYDHPRIVTNRPDNCHPITAYFVGSTVVVESKWLHLSAHSISMLPPVLAWEDELHATLPDISDDNRTSYHKGDMVLVSDGSFKNPYGTSAWLLTFRTSSTYWTGTCRTTGTCEDQDSHRAEVFGILGGIITFHRWLDSWETEQSTGLITVAADNLSALRYSFDTDTYPFIGPSIPDFDVLRSLRSILRPSITYRWRHVKGHQNKNSSTTLDEWANWNIIVDRLAGIIRQQLHDTQAPTTYQALLPQETWKLQLLDKKLCKPIVPLIHDYISQQLIKPYWNKKKRVPTAMFSQIAWTSLGKAMQSLPPAKRHWITKQAAQCCGVNKVLFRWKQKVSPNCPRCGEIETTTHVLRCQHPEVQALWERSLQQLDDWLIQQNTNESLRHSIVSNLRNWYSGTSSTNNRTIWECEQDRVGWDFFLEGCIVSTWEQFQSDHFTRLGKKSNGRRWLTSLIRKLWDIAWDLWEHRNGIEHANDQLALLEQVNKEIELECQQGFSSLPSYRYGDLYSNATVESLAEATFEYKRCWVKHIRLARKREQERITTTTDLSRMRRLMRTFVGLQV